MMLLPQLMTRQADEEETTGVDVRLVRLAVQSPALLDHAHMAAVSRPVSLDHQETCGKGSAGVIVMTVDLISLLILLLLLMLMSVLVGDVGVSCRDSNKLSPV